MHKRNATLTAAILLALGGCAVGPDYVRPDSPLVPADYKYASAGDYQRGRVDPKFWTLFDDPTLIEVVEKDVPLIKIGQRADVRAEAYPNEVFEGTVTRIVQALNRATRTMTVEVDLPNKDHRLKGGMFARVEVLVGKHPQAIQIPLDAVSRLEESQYVYVVKDGKAHQVPVELGARAENRVEVVTGLTGDEQVIVSGKDLVSEGAAVQTQPMDTVKRES